ncbi:MAG: YsnF/AvaK domain-containing protein [Candidatus Eremiobacteraeota bacterium]|nr:YsnF/AvaK domain-containing protein [Candidatus Eremiobacteraeota bacterium]MBC5803308.1 YsnF/AvaK domain-containing protein [Candidatus Eremiobacteraeota bacterium]MBC5822913.1 YsnF/AvaK domain-containing protein [Candidatus Eremiobacteraeota bacterium]
MNQGTSAAGRGGVVAGLFRDSDQGQRALADLKAAGFDRAEISQADDDAPAPARETAAADAYDVSREGRRPAGDVTAQGSSAATSPFFREHDSSTSGFVDELVRLNFSKRDAHDLVGGLVKGQALVTVDGGADMDRALAIMKQYKADIRYTAGTSATSGATPATAAGAAAVTADDEDRELQLRAERLVVNKQRVSHGDARVRKEVVTEMQSIDVPVSREELVIERRPVSGAQPADAGPIGDETIRIPLSEERVNVTKDTVVREEVEVGKRRVESTERVTDTVRHEELRVDESTANDNPPN